MADMKMRKNSEGYLVQLTEGQMKKWGSYKSREIQVNSHIINKKWEGTSYALKIGKREFKVEISADKEKKEYAVKITCNKALSQKTYRTWECNDCVMRMILELNHSIEIAEKEKKSAPIKEAK
jgi:hypothetical protein